MAIPAPRPPRPKRKRSREPAVVRRVPHALARRRDWDWFYFENDFVNSEGLDLIACFERYGVGGWEDPSPNGMVAAYIHLDDRRTAKHCFMLGAKCYATGVQAYIKQYEEPKTRKIDPRRTFGAELRDALVECEFDVVG